MNIDDMPKFDDPNSKKASTSKSGKTLSGINLDDWMPRIAVIGVGGAGSNTVSALNTKFGETVAFVKFFAFNTDVQSLKCCSCDEQLMLGAKITKGKGAGANPVVGRQAALDSYDEIAGVVKEYDMVIITAGFGGGTGTGATEIVAQAAKEAGALTIAIVTKPFMFEGVRRMEIAQEGIRSLKQHVDTLIICANDRLSQFGTGAVSLEKAFELADNFLSDCIINFVSIIQEPGKMNIDFADIRRVAQDRRSIGMFGSGYAEGEGCGPRAMKEAVESLYLDQEADEDLQNGNPEDDLCYPGWSKVQNIIVYYIYGSEDLPIHEVVEAGNYIKERIAPNAEIITGTITKPDIAGLRIFIFGTTGQSTETTNAYNTNTKLTVSYSNASSKNLGSKHTLHETVKSYGDGSQSLWDRIIGKNPQTKKNNSIFNDQED